ncbi:hypothetical protein CJT67_17245 [Pseudomonas aeruginosa]|nr:hypothetical protein APB08_32300 [Pseudomonas aeruginosa]PBX96313.1 hypothetical protein CJT66_21525 [Pseudomonas aeruginosa]PBY02283.1 hypothetical protein CJT65_26105 [Pseudomonas aeruginosa]PCB84844.1 hypothetical protein CJT67_17245 [Pseudomonas aeruginosa]
MIEPRAHGPDTLRAFLSTGRRPSGRRPAFWRGNRFPHTRRLLVHGTASRPEPWGAQRRRSNPPVPLRSTADNRKR